MSLFSSDSAHVGTANRTGPISASNVSMFLMRLVKRWIRKLVSQITLTVSVHVPS